MAEPAGGGGTVAYPCVRVQWLDTYFRGGWQEGPGMDASAAVQAAVFGWPGRSLVESVGLLVGRAPEYVVLALSANGTGVADLLVIPRGSVRALEYLGQAAGPSMGPSAGPSAVTLDAGTGLDVTPAVAVPPPAPRPA